MTTNRKIGIVIVLASALVAAAGIVSGYFSREIAVGIAVIGIVTGTGVTRGKFSRTPGATRKD